MQKPVLNNLREIRREQTCWCRGEMRKDGKNKTTWSAKGGRDVGKWRIQEGANKKKQFQLQLCMLFFIEGLKGVAWNSVAHLCAYGLMTHASAFSA